MQERNHAPAVKSSQENSGNEVRTAIQQIKDPQTALERESKEHDKSRVCLASVSFLSR
jgi:hypothetical protein